MEVTPHRGCISSLTILYNVLADQQVYSADNIILPSQATQGFEGNRISEIGASSNGFDPEVVEFLRHIPYLDDPEYKIAKETFPLKYLDQDEAPFELARDPTYQERTDLMARNDAVLTGGVSPYGTTIIYNVKDETVKEWSPFESADHPSECPASSMDSPKNVLYRTISRFLTLTTFLFPLDDSGNLELYLPFEEIGVKPSIESMGHEERRHWADMQVENERQASFREVYINSGWDIGAAAQELDGLISAEPIHQNVAIAQSSLPTTGFGVDHNQDSICLCLERARLAAKQNFRAEEFQQRKEAWIQGRS